ncbi:hypothetical protein [Desulfovibrio sp. ZJ200]|uniref:hypothetical protein n=1 Tax=Desulfovibrio sp. ZJ200 TaxID=2709792 RepID=UPI0013EC7FD9|nr:hypothetical protein [Desulfovibrio sp. ZJ200]
MESPSQSVTRLTNQACAQYPGGLRAVFAAIREREGDAARSESTFYADLNPNPTSQGKLKVRDFMACMEITGNVEPLRYMASLFGYSLANLAGITPDAPTVEAEMLQDYPAVVAFHEAVQDFKRGAVKYETVLARLEGALLDLRQTAAMVRRDKDA